MFKNVVVIDFEAYPDTHGRPFPVEIGVAPVGGKAISTFIRPKPSWQPGQPTWDRHPWLLEQAYGQGKAPDDLARWILRNLAGKTLLSDAAWIDQPLLRRLLEDHGHAFELVEFFRFLDRQSAARGIDKAMVNRWIVEIDTDRGEEHRAGEDARVRAALLTKLANAR